MCSASHSRSQSITIHHKYPSQFITIHRNPHHNPSQYIAIHRNPSQRQARWYQVQYQVGYQVGYQDGHHRIGIRFELTHKHKCSNRNRIGAYLLAARRLSVRSGEVLAMCCRPTEDRDDGIREAECEGGEGCRLAAGRLQGGQSVRQEACAPGSVAGSGVASRAKYTSEVKVS